MSNHTLTPVARKVRNRPFFIAMVKVTRPVENALFPETTTWRTHIGTFASKANAISASSDLITAHPDHFIKKHDREYAEVRQFNSERAK